MTNREKTAVAPKRKTHCLSLNPLVAKAGAQLAQDQDLSFSRLVERLVKREALKAGFMK